MRPVVDPFVPQPRRVTQLPRRPVQRTPRATGGSIDGMRSVKRRPALTLSAAPARPQWVGPRDPSPPAVAQARAAPLPQPAPDVPAYRLQRPEPGRRIARILERLQTPGIIAGGLAAGLLAQSQLLGEAAIAAYGVYALVRRVRSRTTFLYALCMMLGIIALLVVSGNGSLATNMAAYAYLLLCIGVISLGIELYRGEA